MLIPIRQLRPHSFLVKRLASTYRPQQEHRNQQRKMTKSKKSRGPPPEGCLMLPKHPELAGDEGEGVELVDTHTHILSTYAAYTAKYPPPDHTHQTIKSFAKDVLQSHGITHVVDVWCEAPMVKNWREVVDSLSELNKDDKDEGMKYSFVVGAHPHEAKEYGDEQEREMEEAYRHELCVGWGEIGLDYHYDNSPREEQKSVLRRQLRKALGCGLDKAITIHTREADDDIWTILTEEVPKYQRLHIHCFTDSPELAIKLLNHFPNLYIGITGVITYSSNHNTSQVIRNFSAAGTTLAPPANPSDFTSSPLRIVLETDAPYMVPSILPPPSELGMKGGQKMPFCHSGMLPWTAQFVAKVLNEGRGEDDAKWTTTDVLKVARENARKVYGV
ncbi:Metallo-dependent hydrolase [Meredithblackwellia eburnea MCA 4105]